MSPRLDSVRADVRISLNFILSRRAGDDVKSLIQPYNKVSELIDNAYREVSKVVLKTLCEEFKMSAHLEALRKYMLLGQGDFIHHLLEIIE